MQNSILNQDRGFNDQVKLPIQDRILNRKSLDRETVQQKDGIELTKEVKQKNISAEKSPANFSSFYLVYKFAPNLSKVSVSYEPNFQANFIDELS